MLSFTNIVVGSAMMALVSGHAAILNVQSDQSGPTGIGFKVDPGLARNCTTINPCQQDATLIRDAEIKANTVNECGRTEISGNIDIGENTENQLAAKQIAQVKAGSQLTVTIHQVNADGAGPFFCDLDPTSNSMAATGQTPLEVVNNVPGVNGFSQAKEQDFNITVKMPADLKCTGASTGNICTVRCRNNAVAGPFGGCFPVQQTDVTPTQNTPQNIKTAQDLEGVLKKVQQNAADLPAAIQANQVDGTAEGKANAETATKLLGTPDVIIKESAASNTGPSADAAAGGNTGNAGGNTGNAAKGGNANKQKGKANNNKANSNKAGKQQRRQESGALRWAKRYIVPGADFQPEIAP